MHHFRDHLNQGFAGFFFSKGVGKVSCHDSDLLVHRGARPTSAGGLAPVVFGEVVQKAYSLSQSHST